MIPAAFDYVRASSVDQALQAMAGGAKVLAGGQSLLPLLKMRLASAERLVDVGRLGELRGVRAIDEGRRVAIGALTTYADLLDDPILAHYGVFRDSLPNIGDVQVRNRGTIGGSIAHADPASDMPAILLALDAEIVVRSVRGERTIPIGGFFAGAFTTGLAHDELITEIRIPGGMPGFGSAYRSVEQPASGYSIAGVATVIGRFSGGSGPWDVVSVGVAGVGEHPYRAAGVEAALLAGASPAEAAAHATDGQIVASDIHADREYRAAIAAIQVRRALEAAIARAG